IYAESYESDAIAPSLYHRRSAGQDGWSVVSEPFERGSDDWQELPPGSFATVTPEGVRIEPFSPVMDA
ncbi:MAG: class II glutamine amidotransferase, partial [Pseudomonadota bacterium]